MSVQATKFVDEPGPLEPKSRHIMFAIVKEVLLYRKKHSNSEGKLDDAHLGSIAGIKFEGPNNFFDRYKDLSFDSILNGGMVNGVPCTKWDVTPVPEYAYFCGDIHGDLIAFLGCLWISNSIDAKGNWIQNQDTVFVITGDIVDRFRGDGHALPTDNGRSDLDILQLIHGYNKQGISLGQKRLRIVTAFGNHDFFRDSTYSLKYAGIANSADDNKSTREYWSGNRNWSTFFDSKSKSAEPTRRYFACQMSPAIKVGNIIGVHAGLTKEAAKWAKDTGEMSPLQTICDFLRKYSVDATKSKDGEAKAPESILFNRLWGNRQRDTDCSNLDFIFKTFGLDAASAKMVVGHTIQQNVNSVCDQRVWRIDVGLSAGFGQPKTLQILKVTKPGSTNPSIIPIRDSEWEKMGKINEHLERVSQVQKHQFGLSLKDVALKGARYYTCDELAWFIKARRYLESRRIPAFRLLFGYTPDQDGVLEKNADDRIDQPDDNLLFQLLFSVAGAPFLKPGKALRITAEGIRTKIPVQSLFLQIYPQKGVRVTEKALFITPEFISSAKRVDIREVVLKLNTLPGDTHLESLLTILEQPSGANERAIPTLLANFAKTRNLLEVKMLDDSVYNWK